MSQRNSLDHLVNAQTQTLQSEDAGEYNTSESAAPC